MTRVRVLVAHNAYQLPGGEDRVVAAETALLREHGHEVEHLFRSNDDLAPRGAWDRLRIARDAIWSPASAAAMRDAIRHFRPDIVHVHNTLAVLSPSIYWAAAEAGVAVVQSLHNFRLACPQAMFLRDGAFCDRCLGRLPLPGILHGCYRNSRLQTLTVAAGTVIHRAIGTWRQRITRYIAMSEHARSVAMQSGVPSDRIRIKPNFVFEPAGPPDADIRTPAELPFLFVGRLTEEKGIGILAEAMRACEAARCVVIGDGPLRSLLEGQDRLVLRGWQPPAVVASALQGARALIVPSVCAEQFPLAPLEAFSHSIPVIASRIGSLPEIVDDGVTGLLTPAGDSRQLAGKLRWMMEHAEEAEAMGRRARDVQRTRYGAARNYEILNGIYEEALHASGS